jgi:hypothetical protein
LPVLRRKQKQVGDEFQQQFLLSHEEISFEILMDLLVFCPLEYEKWFLECCMGTHAWF